MHITDKGILIPISVKELNQAFNMKRSPLFSNIQYTLQYLEVFDYQIKNICTTDTVKKIFYKNYLVNALSVIESIFLHVLRENNAMPKENYIEMVKFPTNEKKSQFEFY